MYRLTEENKEYPVYFVWPTVWSQVTEPAFRFFLNFFFAFLDFFFGLKFQKVCIIGLIFHESPMDLGLDSKLNYLCVISTTTYV